MSLINDALKQARAHTASEEQRKPAPDRFVTREDAPAPAKGVGSDLVVLAGGFAVVVLLLLAAGGAVYYFHVAGSADAPQPPSSAGANPPPAPAQTDDIPPPAAHSETPHSSLAKTLDNAEKTVAEIDRKRTAAETITAPPETETPPPEQPHTHSQPADVPTKPQTTRQTVQKIPPHKDTPETAEEQTPKTNAKERKPAAPAEQTAPENPAAIPPAPARDWSALFRLTGIFSDGRGRMALLNGRTVRAGDRIGPADVKEIRKDRVILQAEGHLFEIQLGTQ